MRSVNKYFHNNIIHRTANYTSCTSENRKPVPTGD